MLGLATFVVLVFGLVSVFFNFLDKAEIIDQEKVKDRYLRAWDTIDDTPLRTLFVGAVTGVYQRLGQIVTFEGGDQLFAKTLPDNKKDVSVPRLVVLGYSALYCSIGAASFYISAGRNLAAAGSVALTLPVLFFGIAFATSEGNVNKAACVGCMFLLVLAPSIYLLIDPALFVLQRGQTLLATISILSAIPASIAVTIGIANFLFRLPNDDFGGAEDIFLKYGALKWILSPIYLAVALLPLLVLLTFIAFEIAQLQDGHSLHPRTFRYLAANVIFDAVSIATTYNLILWLRKSASLLKFPMVLVLDLLVAAGCATTGLRVGLAQSPLALTWRQSAGVLLGVDPFTAAAGHHFWPVFWSMHTTFMPTLVLLVCLTALYLLKLSLEVARFLLGKGAVVKSPLAFTAVTISMMLSVSAAISTGIHQLSLWFPTSSLSAGFKAIF